MGDCLPIGKPFHFITGHKGRPSFPFFGVLVWNSGVAYRELDAARSHGGRNILRDPIWQVTLRSDETGSVKSYAHRWTTDV